jgi:acyl-coenzyme A thioesterase 13
MSAEKTAELARVQSAWAVMKAGSPIYQFLLDDVDIFSVEHGIVLARLKVQPVHLNSKGTLHGTVSACITDWAGGLAIASTGREKTGLSTDIHTTFVSAAKLGDVLEIEGRASKVGNRLAFTTIEIRRLGESGADDSVICSGTHTKYMNQ